jgi:hypothetical protein
LLSISLLEDAARAGHSWTDSLSSTYRARGSGCYRGLAGGRYHPIPATLMGFNALRSVAPIPG